MEVSVLLISVVKNIKAAEKTNGVSYKCIKSILGITVIFDTRKAILLERYQV